MSRPLRTRYAIQAHFPLDHHPLIPSPSQILPDSPCPPSLNKTSNFPATGKGALPPKGVPTTSIIQPALPPGSTPAVKPLFPPVLNRHLAHHRPRHPLPPLLSPLRPLQIPFPSPKDGKNVRPPKAAHTLSIITAGRLHGSTPVSRTLLHPFSPLQPLRAPSISVLFPRDGRCA